LHKKLIDRDEGTTQRSRELLTIIDNILGANHIKFRYLDEIASIEHIPRAMKKFLKGRS
jgi:hypothetical protein